MSAELLPWTTRLEQHFGELHSSRITGSRGRVFALEHGLAPDEVKSLAQTVRASIAAGRLLRHHPLPWIVYASELGDLVGRVISIDTSHREPPDFDVCRALTKLLWACLALMAPLALFGHTLVELGPIIAAAGVLGALFLMSCLARLLPLNFIWFAYFNGRSEEQVPVWYARVRNAEDESEVIVRLKGLFSRGNVAADDLVRFNGTWRDGVLMATDGFNQRTQSAVEFHQSQWWTWLLLTAVIFGAVASHLYETWISLNQILGQQGAEAWRLHP